MLKGRIIKSQGGFYDIVDENKVKYVCKPRGKMRYDNITPVVGDYVLFIPTIEGENYGTIEKIEKRYNEMLRPMVANVDLGLIVISASEPSFSFYILDKFLVLLELENIKPQLIVTKVDLLNDDELTDLKSSLFYYKKNLCDVIYISEKNINDNYDKIKKLIKGKVAFVIGQTGAGKSTLLNNIKPELNLETNAISKALGRGRHTTRTVCLYEIADGYIADTPGFSSLELRINDESLLRQSFVDFFKLSEFCKFRHKCLHISSPKCAVKDAVIAKQIPKIRYENYLRFVEEVNNNKEMNKSGNKKANRK